MQQHSPFFTWSAPCYCYLQASAYVTTSKTKKQVSFTCYHSKECKVSDTHKEQTPGDSWIVEHPILYNVYETDRSSFSYIVCISEMS